MNTTTNLSESPLGLIDVLAQLWRRKVVVVLITAAFAAAALAWSLLQEKTYEAKAFVSVGESATQQLLGFRQGDIEAQRRAGTSAAELRSTEFASRLQNKAGLGHRPSLRALTTPQSDVIQVIATARTAETAQNDANVAAKEFVKTLRESQLREIADVTDALTAKIEDIDKRLATTSNDTLSATLDRRRDGLLESLKDLDTAAAATETGVARVVSTAGLPTSPVAPKPFRNGFAGGMLGAVAATVIALRKERPTAERFDDDDTHLEPYPTMDPHDIPLAERVGAGIS